MDDYLGSLGEAQVFNTMNANFGYWKVLMDNKAKGLTTTTTQKGYLRFIHMPFGIMNAPAIFRWAMDIFLSRVKWKSALVYLDDLIIFSRSIGEHFTHVRAFLRLFQPAGATPMLNQFFFFHPLVNYLGHAVLPGKLHVAKATTNYIKNAKPTRNHTELRSFLGLCSLFRPFVTLFTKKASPLTYMLKKEIPPKFDALTDEQFEANQNLKEQLVSPSILALLKPNKPYILNTYALATQGKCALLQE